MLNGLPRGGQERSTPRNDRMEGRDTIAGRSLLTQGNDGERGDPPAGVRSKLYLGRFGEQVGERCLCRVMTVEKGKMGK